MVMFFENLSSLVGDVFYVILAIPAFLATFAYLANHLSAKKYFRFNYFLYIAFNICSVIRLMCIGFTYQGNQVDALASLSMSAFIYFASLALIITLPKRFLQLPKNASKKEKTN